MSLLKHSFKLPIERDDYVALDTDTITGLELGESRSKTHKSVAETILDPQSKIGVDMAKRICSGFSKNEKYIQDTIHINNYLRNSTNPIFDNVSKSCFINADQVNERKSVIETTPMNQFRLKFQYLNIDKLSWLNTNTLFSKLQMLYNLGAPGLSILSPIIGIIIAYLVVWVKTNGQAGIQEFVNVLKQYLPALINLSFLTDPSVSLYNKAKILLMCVAFVVSIYQNIQACKKYYTNYGSIQSFFRNVKQLLHDSDKIIKIHEPLFHDTLSYKEFLEDIKKSHSNLKSAFSDVWDIVDSSILNLNHTAVIMHHFYKLKNEETLLNDLDVVIKYLGFSDVLSGIERGIKNGRLGKATLSKNTGKMIKMFHPLTPNPVQCSFDTKNNIIVSGPNGSGKTTYLKSFCINHILVQQIGTGCFKSFDFSKKNQIVCVINIPDTNDRDSLFEAEARRCHQIYRLVKNEQGKSLCVFDEIFSGTNTSEATQAGIAFLKSLQNQGAQFMVTTHLSHLCKKLDTFKKILNYKFSINEQGVPDYKIKKGISKQKGAIASLKRLGFDKDILASMID